MIRAGALVLPALSLLSTGCVSRYFYSRPASAWGDFRGDHSACNQLGRQRAKQALPLPPGWYRSQDRDEIVEVNSQPLAASATSPAAPTVAITWTSSMTASRGGSASPPNTKGSLRWEEMRSIVPRRLHGCATAHIDKIRWRRS